MMAITGCAADVHSSGLGTCHVHRASDDGRSPAPPCLQCGVKYAKAKEQQPIEVLRQPATGFWSPDGWALKSLKLHEDGCANPMNTAIFAGALELGIGNKCDRALAYSHFNMLSIHFVAQLLFNLLCGG